MKTEFIVTINASIKRTVTITASDDSEARDVAWEELYNDVFRTGLVEYLAVNTIEAEPTK